METEKTEAPIPERGDVSGEPTAERLTEALAEHQWHIARWSGGGFAWGCSCGEPGTGTAAENPGRYVRHPTHHDAAQAAVVHVERILADRLVAVQAEHSPGETCEEADERAADNWRRAESAEAERDDLRAALDRVKALADHADEMWAAALGTSGASGKALVGVDRLRAAVEGGRS